MKADPAKLPAELVPFAEALELATCRPSARPQSEGWKCPQFPEAPLWPLIANAPPFDGVYRGSWMSPRPMSQVCPVPSSRLARTTKNAGEYIPVAHWRGRCLLRVWHRVNSQDVPSVQNAVLELGIKVASAVEANRTRERGPIVKTSSRAKGT